MKIIYLLFIFSNLASTLVSAEISRLRASGNFGFGIATVESFGGSRKTYSETPFGGSGSLDYFLNPLIDIGVEHIRSYGNNQTGVGLTGVSFKFYFYNDHPQYFSGIISGETNEVERGKGYYHLRAITPYLGIGGGFAQATIPSVNVLALNEYLSFKAGYDYPIGTFWGFRNEANFAFSLAGSGKTTLINLIFGIYIFL